MDALTAGRTPSETRSAVIVAVVFATVLAAVRLTPTVGLYHDDAIYMAVGQSLADGDGYRIASLPGNPPQTKYPPLYSFVLAAFWSFGSFPAIVLWIKAFNLLCVGLLLVGVGRWQHDRLPAPVLAGTLVVIGTSPGLLGFADYVLTDLLFAAVVVWALALLRRLESSDSARVTGSLLVLCAAAITLRSVAAAVVAAAGCEFLWRRQWRRAVLVVVAGGSIFAIWTGWAASLRLESPGPLLTYYVDYEPSALSYLRSRPAVTLDIIWGNVQLAWRTLRLSLGPAWAIGGPVLGIVALAGAWHVRRAERPALLFAAFYVGLVLLHPFSPHRYLLPLAPLIVVLLMHGAVSIAALVRPASHAGRTGIAAALCLCFIVPNVLLSEVQRTQEPGMIRGSFGYKVGFGWDGFEETFSWVRAHTDERAVLGTAFDGAYFLYTGRRGIRPWIHHADTYFYPVDRTRPFVGEPDEVAAELDRLGITHLIVDPVKDFAEGRAVLDLFETLIQKRNLPLVFTSSDGLHHVYRWRSLTAVY